MSSLLLCVCEELFPLRTRERAYVRRCIYTCARTYTCIIESTVRRSSNSCLLFLSPLGAVGSLIRVCSASILLFRVIYTYTSCMTRRWEISHALLFPSLAFFSLLFLLCPCVHVDLRAKEPTTPFIMYSVDALRFDIFIEFVFLSPLD